MSAPAHSQPQPADMDEQARQKRRRLRLILLGVIPGGVLLLTLIIYLLGGRDVETDNAYVKASKVPVSAELSSTVREVLVDDNQAVTAGQLPFRLEPHLFSWRSARPRRGSPRHAPIWPS